MHEFTLAQTIFKAALAELKKYPAARLKAVHVVVGQQHAIAPENLRFAFEVLSRNTAAESAALAIHARPVAARCRQCGWNGAIRNAFYRCAACGTGDIEVTGGSELYLDSLEVEPRESSHD